MAKKVLVIDDSKTVRDQVRLVLERAGYSVVEAADGQQGLDQIGAQPDITMAICDINMPVMTGIGMLETLKKSGVAMPPIVMLTTEGQPALIQKAKQAGARGWIVKPFNPEHLLAAVNKLAGAA